MAEIVVAELLAELVNRVDSEILWRNILNEFVRLLNELKIGSIVSRNLQKVTILEITDRPSSSLEFSPVGEGAFGECFLVEPTEQASPFITNMGKFIAKKIIRGDEKEIIQEIAHILLITNLGHYGIIESKTFELNGETHALVVSEFDSSQNRTVYATMKYIKGKSLNEAIENNELTAFHKLRIAVRVADTLNFLHRYRLAHCDLNFTNIMLKQGTNDPVLIDLGNMRNTLAAGYSKMDSTDYHTMIYKMYQKCHPSEIPPMLKPIFDNWDDPDHCHMSFCEITEKYFGTLSAYNTTVSMTDSATGRSNILPCKRAGGLFMVDLAAAEGSKSFTDYLELSMAGTKLAEQDEMIGEYIQLLHKDKTHQALQPPLCRNTLRFASMN